MAHPIPSEAPKRDPRADLLDRLEQAPVEHAEALLELYEILQGLHDRGALELARGTLGAGDQVLDILVTAARSPQSIRGIRNLFLLVNMLAEIEPGVLRSFTQAVPAALHKAAEDPDKPGLWRLIGDFLWNEDFRHGMAVVNTLLDTFGKSLLAAHKSGGQDSRTAQSGM